MGSKLGQVVVVTSGKGGVGKTTSVANICCALAKKRFKVVALDLDIGLKKLDLILGLENRVIYDIIQVVEGECTLKQALVRDKRFPDLYMLPAAQTRNKEDINSEQIIDLCNQLREDFDYIFIDCPAGIEQGFKNAIIAADRAIVVTNPEISAIRDADRIIGLLESFQFEDIKLIINRVRPSMVKNNNMLSVNDILEHLSIELLGIVPEDKNVLISTNAGEPVALNEKTDAGLVFNNIAQRLVGNNVPFLNLEENTSFWKRIKNIVFAN